MEDSRPRLSRVILHRRGRPCSKLFFLTTVLNADLTAQPAIVTLKTFKERVVKLIVAVIQPTKFNAVREALEKIEVERMTVCDAQSFSRHRERVEQFRGREFTTRLLRKVVLEIVVNDDFLDRTLETIVEAARTGPAGSLGDGKVFVLPAEQAIQVADAARGPGAV